MKRTILAVLVFLLIASCRYETRTVENKDGTQTTYFTMWNDTPVEDEGSIIFGAIGSAVGTMYPTMTTVYSYKIVDLGYVNGEYVYSGWVKYKHPNTRPEPQKTAPKL